MKNLTVRMLGKEYQIACPSGKETELQHAALYLDKKMTEIRSNGRIINFEGILVTVAINLAHELLQQTENLVNNVTSLENKLNNALQGNTVKNLSSNNFQFEYNDN